MRQAFNFPIRGSRARPSTQTAAFLTGLLVVAVGCGGTGENHQIGLSTEPTTPPIVSPGSPRSAVPSIWLGSQVRELMAGSSFVLVGSAFPDVTNTSAGPDTAVAIVWRTDDGGAVSVQAIDKSRVRVRGEHSGTAWIEGRAFGGASYVYLTVLDAAPAGTVSPIVVDDFRVVEHHYGLDDPEFTYSPQIMLHDSTASGHAAVIAASFDIPGLDPTAPCATLRSIGAAPRKMFFESYREFEMNIRQPGRSSVMGATVVAHLTIRLPNDTAMTMTASGPVVSGPIPVTDDGWPETADYLACG